MKQHLTFRQSLAVLAVILFSSALFLCLYFYDNKYTQDATQAVNGLLVLSNEDLEEEPLRFLSRGWAFYPDVLLTPQTYAEQSSYLYMNYISIGEYTRFDMFGRRNTPHGCGTYALQLRLPQETQTYALALPEIFSAFRLYLNGTLILQEGDPDPQHYVSQTRQHMVTFDAGGEVTILLAVSDYSHFYSGLVYPPAFGKHLALNANRDLRLGMELAVVIVVMIAVILAVYLGIYRKQPNAFLYALLCLSMGCSSSYQLLHSQFGLPVFPWYGLELAGKYLVTLLVLILHNRICRTGRCASLTSSIAAAAFCLLSLIYGLSSAYLTVPVMQLFSALADIYKIFTALYLILTAYRSLGLMDGNTSFLFYASILYASGYLWDRILPAFDPIYGGWFPEWGSFSMVAAAGITLWQDILRAYSYNLAFAEEHRQVTRQLTMQIAYTRQISEHAQENRRLIHDFRQHIRTLTAIAQESGDTPVLNYLGGITQLTGSDGSGQLPSLCSSAAPDALLQYYYNCAREKQISMDIRFSLPGHLPLTDVELCTVLGNLMENAMEACERKPLAQRSILLASQEDPHTYFLLLENSYDGKVNMQNGRFLSRKSMAPRMGIGLESARKIIERCGGTFDIYPLADMFRVGISLPIGNDPE